MSSHSASEASGEGSVNGRLDSKYVTRTFDADRVDESLCTTIQKKKRKQINREKTNKEISIEPREKRQQFKHGMGGEMYTKRAHG